MCVDADIDIEREGLIQRGRLGSEKEREVVCG